MSEILTTGQMIDRLKVGEEAECIETNVEDWLNSTVKAQPHFWNWTLITGKSEEFYVSKAVQNCKWIIKPKFVPFEEAMKALIEGKLIEQHIDDNDINTWRYRYEDEYIVSWYKRHGKWTLWEQCNGKGALCSLEGKWIIAD